MDWWDWTNLKHITWIHILCNWNRSNYFLSLKYDLNCIVYVLCDLVCTLFLKLCHEIIPDFEGLNIAIEIVLFSDSKGKYYFGTDWKSLLFWVIVDLWSHISLKMKNVFIFSGEAHMTFINSLNAVHPSKSGYSCTHSMVLFAVTIYYLIFVWMGSMSLL